MTMFLTDLFIRTVATANFLACHYSDSFLIRISNSDYPKFASKWTKTYVSKRLTDLIFDKKYLSFNKKCNLVTQTKAYTRRHSVWFPYWNHKDYIVYVLYSLTESGRRLTKSLESLKLSRFSLTPITPITPLTPIS